MIEAFDFLWLAQQITGLGAVTLSFYAVSRPSGKKIMLVQAMAGFLFMSHYLLNGLTNLAFISLTGVIASFVSSFATPQFLKQYNIAHSTILIGYLLFTMVQPYQSIPVFICVLGYYRAISRDNLSLFLSLAFLIHISWALYHAFFGTYYGMLNDSVLALLNLAAFYFRTRRKAVWQQS